jgi:hypothetical protein
MFFVLLAVSTMVSFVALLVALPQCAQVYHRFIRGHVVECPERHQQSTVMVSAGIAAGTSVILNPVLVVRGCALWPENKRCRRRCVAQLHSEGS